MQMHFITGMNAVPHYECLADTALDLLAPPASQAGIHRTRVFRLRTADSRTPQENDKIARDASQTETNC